MYNNFISSYHPLSLQVGVPLRYLFDQLCFVFVYIFCAHWFPPLWRFTVRQLKALGAIVHKHVLEPVKMSVLYNTIFAKKNHQFKVFFQFQKISKFFCEIFF